MIKSCAYSSSGIDQVFHRLQLKQKNGIYFEYDIRVDGETLFPRTNSLENFFLFQNFIVSTTEVIRFQLYKGKSNRYDCFEFLRNQKSENTENYPALSVEQKIEEALKKQKAEFELITLKNSVVRYKEKTRELKERVSQLEGELRNGSMISGVTQMIQQAKLIQQGGQPVETQTTIETKPLNGQTSEVEQQQPNTPIQSEQKESCSSTNVESMDEVTQKTLTILRELKEKLPNETFQKLMGTTLMLGDHPEIIPETRIFIAQTLKSKEK